MNRLELKLDDPSRPIPFREKWSPKVQIRLWLYFCLCYVGVCLLPNYIWDPDARSFVYIIGILGVWRYSWWGNHWLRALVYERVSYPKKRQRAAELWSAGWRPRHIHIQMTTFREQRDTSEAVIRALCREIREAGVPATLWLGSSEGQDEERIARHLRLIAGDIDITLRIVRQNQPGKRVAIALVLRAMSRAGLGPNDIAIFMDGDFILHPGVVRKCFPLFALDPSLHALTTDEQVIVRGPRWVQSWLNMRFAQRRLAMQSHALSDRVLTLTGRCSIFRATHITSHEFIRLQEADHLHHWLWGTFRFLSGDDKSTWYALLKQGVKMTYVPDASGTTIEVVAGTGFRRMVDNLRRWSGNTLRNGYRAILLGPRRMPLFIWWCCVDQRLAMWTMLFSPVVALAGALKLGATYLIAYIIYIAITRGLLSLVLFTYTRRVDLNFIWCLYANQLLNALVKVYTLWRLSQQRWTNRGDQRQGLSGGGLAHLARNAMAAYLTALSAAGIFLIVMVYSELLRVPSWSFLWTLLNS